MNSFFEFWINFSSLFERNPPLATAYVSLLLFSLLVIGYMYKKHFSKDHLLHEQAKLLHSSLKDSALLSEEYTSLKDRVNKFVADIDQLQKDKEELIYSLEILNEKFVESEQNRLILLNENHEMRIIIQCFYNNINPNQFVSINKNLKIDYKKYLDA